MGALDNVARNNVSCFLDTMERTDEGELKEIVQKSSEAQKVVEDGSLTYEDDRSHRYAVDCKVIVSGKRTLEAAKEYAGKRVCVLNFANAFHPGGGVKSGATAQEESICRISTLYRNLTDPKMINAFYRRHEIIEMDFLGNDDCIYTPDVCVFKTDEQDPILLAKDDRYFVDVITCAAPDLRGVGFALKPKGDKAKALYEKRIRAIFEIARLNGADVLILGAFGCGAFFNDPQTVAAAFKVITDEYRRDFETIEYAVFCKANQTKNYDIFKAALGEEQDA
ncbi:MAG: TIGR02452 family protein [Lachnospiraceae bacterium]|nr:TIGR02452 family protein [Lachnospiraceae bacterium]